MGTATEDTNTDIEHWVEETSGFDRVRSVAFALQQPRTAGEVAEQAHVVEKTARDHLGRLVEIDLLLESDDSTPVTYYPDPGDTRYHKIWMVLGRTEERVSTDER